MRSGSLDALLRLVGVAALAAASVTACFGTSEPGTWRYGFRNDSGSILILRENDRESRIMPARTAQQLYLIVEGENLPIAVFSVDCTGMGSVTLTQDQPYLHVDEAGHISGKQAESFDSASPSVTWVRDPADLVLTDNPACASDGWHVDVRNDWNVDLLVRLSSKYRMGDPERVLSGSRGGLDGGVVDRGVGDDLADGMTAQVLRADCSLVGTVALSHARNVIYVDAGGNLSAEPQAVFWQEPPPASFRATVYASSQCPGAWATGSPSGSP